MEYITSNNIYRMCLLCGIYACDARKTRFIDRYHNFASILKNVPF